MILAQDKEKALIGEKLKIIKGNDQAMDFQTSDWLL